jgi:hypothetical protein
MIYKTIKITLIQFKLILITIILQQARTTQIIIIMKATAQIAPQRTLIPVATMINPMIKLK